MGESDRFAASYLERDADEVVRYIRPVARERVESEVMARAEALPSPPEILAILQERALDDEASVDEIENLLRQDPALVAKLLRLVNSSFFGLRYKVNNISHAIVIVGFNTLRSLIYAAFADELYREEMPAYGYGRRGLWRHSVRCAFSARLLALRGLVERTFAEDLFVAGLLHDVGKVLLWPDVRRQSERFVQLRAEYGGDVVMAERHLCGMDHAEAGALVARQWNLADNLAEAIACHHAPERAENYPKQVSVIHLFNWLLAELRVGLKPNQDHGIRLSPMALERLALDERAVDELKCWLAQTGAEPDELD